MNAPGYRAVPDALRGAADGIDGLVGELGRITSAGRAGRGDGITWLRLDPDEIGHDGLAVAFGTFCDRWAAGVRGLVHDGTAMAQGLRESVRAYEHTEQQVRSSLSQLYADVAADPRADPEQTSRLTTEQIDQGAADRSPRNWDEAGDSIARTWSDVGEDVWTTTVNRFVRQLTGQNPFGPEFGDLGELVD